MKWALLLLLMVLPLQWFLVGGLRLHILAMLLFLVASLVATPPRYVGTVVGVTWAFVAANAALSLTWISANRYHGLGMREPVQQLAYLAVFLSVAAVVHRALLSSRTAWVDTMRWLALVVSLILVAAMAISMSINNIDPAQVFATSVASADPELLQKQLFKAAFVGFGFDEEAANGNFRHEVFAALLLAMSVSSACAGLRPFDSAVARRLYQVSMALAAVLIVLSLSRSVTLALAVWPVLALVRAFLAMRMTPGLAVRAVLAAAGVAALAATGALTVVWVRFTQDTTSYESRDGLLEQAFANIRRHAITGGVPTASESSHNFVLDSWLRAGVFAALAAVVVLVLLVGALVSLLTLLPRGPVWTLPVCMMFVLPLVRLFTSGGGEIPPVSWVGLGIAAGFVTHRRVLLVQERARRSRSEPNAGLSTHVVGSVEGHSTSPRLDSRSDSVASGSSSSSK